MRKLALALLTALTWSTPARANFFWHDRYEPPSPRFGTFTWSAGWLAGGWGTATLDDEPLWGTAWNVVGSGQVLVLPATKVGLRVGVGTYGGKTSDGPDTPWVGFRQQSAWTDGIAEIELPWLRVYGVATLAGAGWVRSPLWAYDEPGINTLPFRARNHDGAAPATYRHVGVGLVPRYLPPARSAAPGTPVVGGGVQIEIRRTWMSTRDPIDYAPSEAAGWMVLGTVAIDSKQNVRRAR